MNEKSKLMVALEKNATNFYNVVPFDSSKDKLLLMDFTVANKNLTEALLSDVTLFSDYVQQQLAQNNCTYGIGGYNEDRVLYKVHKHFNTDKANENRTIHLGIDIWASEGTPIYAPLGGMVHSFAFNNNLGDYGGTIILQHQLDTISFHTLYGHLSLKSIEKLSQGQYISRANCVGNLGNTTENGNWPPHLHFQIIEDMQLKEGDYPGVCTIADREKYLANCPNPNLILRMMEYVKKE
jgi:peptidoglycan LD-endopeptidase LytH